ncbi:MAG: hypothetical protein EBR68_06335 [Synechococcaceae bacterium WB4_2_0811]|nr:hypothetical protein [Synechococcaceae bacterium WB4_2_0811]
MANEFAVTYNPVAQKFQHQTNKLDLRTYGVQDATPDQLAELNAEFQTALTTARPKKRAAQIKVCKQLHKHSGKFGSVHVFAESFADGVISPGQLLANVLDIAYDGDDLIDLDG